MKLCPALFFITLLTLLMLTITSPLAHAGSPSLSFSRQTIYDHPNDWKYYPLSPRSNCTNLQSSVQFPDMIGASYFSDGESLNATIWLSSPFQELPTPPFARAPVYGMIIGIIQSHDVITKPDYSAALHWDIRNSTWTMTIWEYLENATRTLVQDNNYQKFYDNRGEEGHVNLSLDLEAVSSPAQYFIVFTAFDGIIERGNACGLVDFIENAVYVPPPEFSITTFPSPLEIRQGEEKVIELKINSTTIGSPLVELATNNVPVGINTTIEPDRTYVPVAGVATSHIKVKVSENVTPASYTLPIYSAISFPNDTIDVNSFINFITVEENGIQNTLVGNASSIGGEETAISVMRQSPRPSYFSLVVNPYPIEERFEEFWETYGAMISLVGGGFAAGLSALLIDRFKSRSKYKSKKIDG